MLPETPELVNNAILRCEDCVAIWVGQDPTDLTCHTLTMSEPSWFATVRKFVPVRVLDDERLEVQAIKGLLDEMKERFGRAGRKVLLAGSHIESDITIVALFLLAEGYDVHVVTNSSTSASARSRRVAETRLCQAGAVLVTLRQVLSEFCFSAEDPSKRMELEQALQSLTQKVSI